jgi:hypothetical protein
VREESKEGKDKGKNKQTTKKYPKLTNNNKKTSAKEINRER